MKWEDASPERRLRDRFLHLLVSLSGPIERLSGREASRAKEIFGELSRMWRQENLYAAKTRTWGASAIEQTLTWLTELEQVLLGQRTLFSPGFRTPKSTSTAKTFRQLRSIVKNYERVEEQLAVEGHIHPSIQSREFKKRQLEQAKMVAGWRKREETYGRKIPEARPIKVKPAMTFAKARDHILVGLGRLHWPLSGALKVPWAEAPDGKVRFWFKPQSIYMSVSSTGKHTLGDARSIYNDDYRSVPTERIVGILVATATKYSGRAHSPAHRAHSTSYPLGRIIRRAGKRIMRLFKGRNR